MSAPKRVLVVDADESIRAVVDVALSDEGYEVAVPVWVEARRGLDTVQHTPRRWWTL